MKFAAFFAVVIFAMSSTSFAKCGSQFGNGGNTLIKSTVAPSSIIGTKPVAAVSTGTAAR